MSIVTKAAPERPEAECCATTRKLPAVDPAVNIPEPVTVPAVELQVTERFTLSPSLIRP